LRYGFQLLKNIPFLVEASNIVYSHHEFYDGTGYPRGLTKEMTPLGARIVAVADALDAITQKVPTARNNRWQLPRKRSNDGADANLTRTLWTCFFKCQTIFGVIFVGMSFDSEDSKSRCPLSITL
jgi:hypothetical protein